VPEQRYNQTKVTEYRAAATELHELFTRVEQQIASAFENGIDQAVHDALAELKASGAEFQKLRSTLTPTELFIAKYNIQVHGAHEVSFVLPQGVSRYEMLSEAQGVVKELDLVWPIQLTKWETDPKFTDSCRTPERIRIDGHVKGGDAKTLAQQEAFLTRKKLPLANLEDLAAAFVAHYVATGQSLFEGKWVRTAGGALLFYSYGLSEFLIDDADSSRVVAVSARVPRISKN
jgi:hypothetical protein